MSTIALVSWTTIFAAFALLWVPRTRFLSLPLLAIGYALGFAAGELDARAIAAIALLLGAGWAARNGRTRAIRVAGHVLFLLLATGLFQHLLPGFLNPRIFGPAAVTPDAVPYTLYLNRDKILIGAWIALAYADLQQNKPVQLWLPVALIVCMLTTLTCLTAASALGLVTWEPKVPEIWLIWCLNNLLFVSFAEEALFRGYVQEGLGRALTHVRYGAWIALVVAALFFGSAHWAGGPLWILMASLAGVGYGVAYRIGGLQAACLTHFGLNTFHFFLFTYPMLASR